VWLTSLTPAGRVQVKAAAYGRVVAVPSQADLERVFFLDDEDRKLVALRRGEHMKAGFALQLVTVRWLGTFLEDPLDVPGEVLDFVAGQLGIADPWRRCGRCPTCWPTAAGCRHR